MLLKLTLGHSDVIYIPGASKGLGVDDVSVAHLLHYTVLA